MGKIKKTIVARPTETPDGKMFICHKCNKIVGGVTRTPEGWYCISCETKYVRKQEKLKRESAY